MNANEKAVADVLTKYEAALNQSDTEAVMKLYADDGVFMPQNSPSSVGADAVRKAYETVFKTIKLTVKFNVAEVVGMAPDWVFAPPIQPDVKVHATGAGGPEANQELFVFQKVDGAWKIARYCFATTNHHEHRFFRMT